MINLYKAFSICSEFIPSDTDNMYIVPTPRDFRILGFHEVSYIMVYFGVLIICLA